MARTEDRADPATRTASATPREAPFGAPYVFVLLAIDGDDASLTHRIVRAETLIGRGAESHLVIEEERVSRVHCRIRVDGPVCTITDCDSRNGTTVNGRPLAPNVALRLRNLDEIEIGSHKLLLLSGRFRIEKK